ncbi:MAG: NADH-quinone oxidoreductase subunit C [Planctomycetes bacterium]|nr:NADH-quinone oxidoreductase subunit C [Planctomycetota bacterium]
MKPDEIIPLLEAQFGAKITGKNLENVDPWVEVEPSALLEVCLFLRADERLQFDFLQCISGVDYCEPDPKKAKRAGFEPHLEVVYHLYSFRQRHQIVVKALLPRWKDNVEGELPEVPSVTGIWDTANWHEREVYDLSGVRFVGHPNLRRILCPEDWVGYPLRKDYEMPLEYHGIRGK